MKSDLRHRASECQVNRVPVPVEGINDATAVAAGGQHSLALLSTGTVWEWGRTDTPAAREAASGAHSLPAGVPGLSQVVGLAAGANHGLALRADGTVWAWGSNARGQVDPDSSLTFFPSPVPVPGLSDVTALASDDFHGLALHSDGTVWSWGLAGFWFEEREAGGYHPYYCLRRVPHVFRAIAIAAGPFVDFAIESPPSRPLPRLSFR